MFQMNRMHQHYIGAHYNPYQAGLVYSIISLPLA